MDVKDCSAETLNVAVDFMYDISIPGNFKEIKISYMKSTVTSSVSAEQSLTSILFSSHLRAASKYSDLWQDKLAYLPLQTQLNTWKRE